MNHVSPTGTPPVRIIAHRGASGQFAEQTRAAYLEAIEQGADAIECDVQLSADGVPFCWHDWTADRCSNGHGRVDELSLAQLQALDVTSWKGAEIPPGSGTPAEQFLTLAQLWQIAAGAGRPIELTVELKQPAPAGADLDRATLDVLRAGGWPASGPRVTLMSFDPRSVARLSAAAGPAATCQLVTTEADLARDAAFRDIAGEACRAARAAIEEGVAGIVGPSVLLCREEPEAVRGWLAAGLTVRVWSTNAEDDAAYLLGLGVTELITDWPARMREVAGRHRAAR